MTAHPRRANFASRARVWCSNVEQFTLSIRLPSQLAAPGWEGLTVKYIMPFEAIRRSVEVSTVRGQLKVSASYDEFIRIIKRLISLVEVDEAWYLSQYEDVAQAVRDGIFPSPRAHFASNGYLEGRMPFPILVDEEWYLEHNPDVADSIRQGKVASAQEHFTQNGYREGRLPFPP
jgi:hypothetical protein